MRFGNHTFIIAEAGINHNGSVDMACELVDAAVEAGADAVKFQIKTPHMCLPPELWDQERDTPWGKRMRYIEYREKMELSPKALQTVVAHCQSRGIIFSASAWDINAANKLATFEPKFIKVASASVTNLELIAHIASFKLPVIMSTGMSTKMEIARAKAILQAQVPALGLLVCTSSYPAAVEDLNLERIHALQGMYPDCAIGYSGHEVGLWTTLCAVAMGACIVERHLTLDRSLPGTDQAASIEPVGFKLLVREIRQFEKARGRGEIRPLECEKKDIARLRGSIVPLTGAHRTN